MTWSPQLDPNRPIARPSGHRRIPRAVYTLLPLLVITGQLACTHDDRSDTDEPAQPATRQVMLVDLEGKNVDPLAEPDAKATVFLFVRSDCPISNRYAPEIRRLHACYSPQGIRFWLVYCDPDESIAAIRQHQREYEFPVRALRDTQHQLVKMTGVSVTPEAAVYAENRRLVYRGRIDDWYVDFGKARAKPTRRDLAAALDALVEGRDVPYAEKKAVGCYIVDLE